MPLSYDSARPILEAMGGANVPPGWQGGLPLAYHVGPGPLEVRMVVSMDYQIRTIWNVIATIKGEVEPDKWVMVGNHRDAWVYGAVDPGSGTAATLEMARAIGMAYKSGWKPRRTLVYGSWDAEEYGLVGSTEWADQHAEEITESAVFLLNVDSAVSGPDLDVDGVPSLRDLMVEAAGSVQDHRSGRSLKDVWMAKKRAAWAGVAPLELDPLWETLTLAEESSKARPPRSSRRSSIRLARVRITRRSSTIWAFPRSMRVFSGKYGVYHSIYDDFFWMEKFGDPEFVTHATAAKLYTLIVMRAASSEVVPLRFTPYGEALREYVDDLRRIVARRPERSNRTRAARQSSLKV